MTLAESSESESDRQISRGCRHLALVRRWWPLGGIRTHRRTRGKKPSARLWTSRTWRPWGCLVV